jgi:D-alanyl-D-alanine-carboxypeptidase/D-alanyl-D-alanine-endopeptidase
MLLGKSGGLGGFMTYVVLSPNRKLGIFVVANRVNFGMFNDIRSSVHELAAELGPQ